LLQPSHPPLSVDFSLPENRSRILDALVDFSVLPLTPPLTWEGAVGPEGSGVFGVCYLIPLPLLEADG